MTKRKARDSEALIVHEVNGLKFLVREASSDIKAIDEVVVRRGYERKGFELGADRTWVDLGANIGAFAVLAAARYGVKRVLAFEPDPVSAHLLRENVKLNNVGGIVEVHEKAVATSDGRATFHINSANGNYWRNGLYKPWRGGYAIEVDVVDFRKVLPRDAAIKMDCEGAEMPILEAMTLDELPDQLVFEWSFDIDGSIPRFKSVIEKLRVRYSNVVYGGFDESAAVWGASWFPPCRTVWCY